MWDYIPIKSPLIISDGGRWLNHLIWTWYLRFRLTRGNRVSSLEGKTSITWAGLYYKYFFQKYLFFYNVVVYPNIYIVFGAIVEDVSIFLCVFRVYVVDCGYLLKQWYSEICQNSDIFIYKHMFEYTPL